MARTRGPTGVGCLDVYALPRYVYEVAPALQFMVLIFIVWVERQQRKVIDYLLEENRILRQRLGPKPVRLTRNERVRLAIKGHTLGRAVLADVASIAKADTILRWYRNLVVRGAVKPNKGPGRPKTDSDVAQLVVRMARESSGWGYSRLKDALANVGIPIGRNTVARILAEHGIEPAPKRKLSWSVFLAAHWSSFRCHRNERCSSSPKSAQVQGNIMPSGASAAIHEDPRLASASLPLLDVNSCISRKAPAVIRCFPCEASANDDVAGKRRFAVTAPSRRRGSCRSRSHLRSVLRRGKAEPRQDPYRIQQFGFRHQGLLVPARHS